MTLYTKRMVMPTIFATKEQSGDRCGQNCNTIICNALTSAGSAFEIRISNTNLRSVHPVRIRTPRVIPCLIRTKTEAPYCERSFYLRLLIARRNFQRSEHLHSARNLHFAMKPRTKLRENRVV